MTGDVDHYSYLCIFSFCDSGVTNLYARCLIDVLDVDLGSLESFVDELEINPHMF